MPKRERWTRATRLQRDIDRATSGMVRTTEFAEIVEILASSLAGLTVGYADGLSERNRERYEDC